MMIDSNIKTINYIQKKQKQLGDVRRNSWRY